MRRSSPNSFGATYEGGGVLTQSEEYFAQRNIVNPRPFAIPQIDLTDRSLLAPISPVGVAPPRADSFSRKASLQTYSPASDRRSFDSRVQYDREMVKDGYDDLVRRLQYENRELKQSEQSLLRIVAMKRSVELELEQVSNQLASYQRSNGEAALERLKHVIRDLTEQRVQLRRQLEHSRAEIGQLINNAAEANGRSERETASLRQQLESLRASYTALMNEYRRERAQPIHLPDSPELKRLLEEKMNEVEVLKARVRFLDGQLQAKSGPCVPCVGKDEMIFQLTNQLRELSVQRAPQPCCVVVSSESCCGTSCCETSCTTRTVCTERSAVRELSTGPRPPTEQTTRVIAHQNRGSEGSVQTVRYPPVHVSPAPAPRVYANPAPTIHTQTTMETVSPVYRQTIVQGQRPIQEHSIAQTQQNFQQMSQANRIVTTRVSDQPTPQKVVYNVAPSYSKVASHSYEHIQTQPNAALQGQERYRTVGALPPANATAPSFSDLTANAGQTFAWKTEHVTRTQSGNDVSEVVVEMEDSVVMGDQQNVFRAGVQSPYGQSNWADGANRPIL